MTKYYHITGSKRLHTIKTINQALMMSSIKTYLALTICDKDDATNGYVVEYTPMPGAYLCGRHAQGKAVISSETVPRYYNTLQGAQRGINATTSPAASFEIKGLKTL